MKDDSTVLLVLAVGGFAIWYFSRPQAPSFAGQPLYGQNNQPGFVPPGYAVTADGQLVPVGQSQTPPPGPSPMQYVGAGVAAAGTIGGLIAGGGSAGAGAGAGGGGAAAAGGGGLFGIGAAATTGIFAGAAVLAYGIIEEGWFRGGEEGIYVNPTRDRFFQLNFESINTANGFPPADAMGCSIALVDVMNNKLHMQPEVIERTRVSLMDFPNGLLAADSKKEYLAATKRIADVFAQAGIRLQIPT